ncbi:hypothetical protein PR202_ga22549 [Eleusine coracana subsp. coracana]|uniref:KIB1-4 beta-propeller domain-containing protein n=1 Tax=Eleusine coracana subsp. coracana TaxID=191504 RepID=A0AAV5D209_ELECO|nr:hypothetical protein PR202_ga22549 [Eleusine coracana subsp. coracana]
MCRPGAEFWLINAKHNWRGLRDIAFYNGKLYAVEDKGDLLEMTVCENDCTGEPMVESTIMRVIWDSYTLPARDGVETPVRCLLVSGGSLLMLCRVLKESAIPVFTVFKANLASLRWSEVRSIGDDVVLFVSRWCSFARHMSYYKLPGNRIYFLDNDVDVCRSHFGAYNMLDDVTYPLLPQLSELSNGRGNTPATWLLPRDKESCLNLCDLPADVLGQVTHFLTSRKDHVHLSEIVIVESLLYFGSKVCLGWLIVGTATASDFSADLFVPYTSQSIEQSIPSFTHRRNKSWREKWNRRHNGRSRMLQQQSFATSLPTPIASASLLFAICGEPWQSGSTRCRCRGSHCWPDSRFFNFPATGTFRFPGTGHYHQ